MSGKKHLALSDRIVVEDGVNRNLPFSTIASSIGKHPTTVAREIKQHRYRHQLFKSYAAVLAIRICCEHRRAYQIGFRSVTPVPF